MPQLRVPREVPTPTAHHWDSREGVAIGGCVDNKRVVYNTIQYNKVANGGIHSP